MSSAILRRISSRNQPSNTSAAGEGSDTVSRVVIIEDEAVIRKNLAAYINNHGFNAIAFGNAQDALDYLNENSGVDLVITDIILPGMSGVDLIAAIRTTQRRVRIIAMSGHDHSSNELSVFSELDAAFLNKPFRMNDLLNLVRAQLDDQAGIPS